MHDHRKREVHQKRKLIPTTTNSGQRTVHKKLSSPARFLIRIILVSLAAVFSIVTQRSTPQTLRDDTKNGCEGDYLSSDKRSIANAFHKYFTNAVSCLVDSLRSFVASPCSSLPCRSSSLPVTHRHPVFQFTEVTESIVLKHRLKQGL